MASKTHAGDVPEMQQRVRQMAELDRSPETLESQIRRVVKEELARLALGPGDAEYSDYEEHKCSICDAILQRTDNWPAQDYPIPHRSVVDCFKAFLKRMRV